MRDFTLPIMGIELDIGKQPDGILVELYRPALRP
jgi:hypothetical protein